MNQKPFRTLILWTIWASTALVVYLTLYRDTEVWSFMERDASHITWLISGLFLLGIIGSFALTMLITKEAIRSAQLEHSAREGGLNAIVIHSGKRAADRFFRSLKSTVEAKGDADVETLLHVELAAFERISHSIEVVGTVLITLGLIGTVMGLTMTLTGLSSSLEALGQDQDMMLSGLQHAMSGMGTAFYATLLGAVLGGVLLRIFAQITQHGVEGLHDNLMRICLVYCSADYVRTVERDVRLLNEEVRALEANIQRLHESFDRSRQTLHDFRTEIRSLSDNSPEGGKPLETLIKEHRAYCELLREEMRLLLHLKRPWWVRLLEVFRVRR